ncbi:hypothetical protein ACERJO_01645 [Halalkalibacter sp. AB-rgal2]|uniref:hypothetical protein n=1 Tax=Halalkalibacter sp. AB-rgal2 TaxID=3242695 RepID=UPI00359E6345
MQRFFLVLIVPLLIISGCAISDSEEDIVNDLTIQQSDENTKEDQPNNMEQNTFLNPNVRTMDLQGYADYTGTYIYSVYQYLETVDELFNDERVINDSIVNDATESLKRLLEEHEHYRQIEEPQPFNGLSDVHSVAIYEIELLLEELNKMKKGQLDNSLEHARRHYENAILSHNLMEREFLSLSEEYGLY